MGLLAIHGAMLRDQGLEGWQIAEKLRDEADNIRVSFVLDTLKYMRKGGRCSGIAAFGANMLNLKPCLETKDAALVVKKNIEERLKMSLCNMLRKCLPLVRI